jgi:hypothetical protein
MAKQSQANRLSKFRYQSYVSLDVGDMKESLHQIRHRFKTTTKAFAYETLHESKKDYMIGYQR